MWYRVNPNYRYRYRLLLPWANLYEALVGIITLGFYSTSASVRVSGMATGDWIRRMKAKRG